MSTIICWERGRPARRPNNRNEAVEAFHQGQSFGIA